jgi:elongation factor 1 alpha-like protein
MSRHKLVKNLDLDDELEDYDGGEYYGDDGEDTDGRYSCVLAYKTIN